MGRDKSTLGFTLLDYFDTTEEKLIHFGHLPGPKCKWILKLGTFYDHGLNSRDEVKSKSRYNWKSF